MFKWLLLLIIAGTTFYLWKSLKQLKQQVKPPPTDTTEPMVKCNYCDVYTPQKEAVYIAGQWYCCTEHATQARR